jgi:hypothetical protein
MAALAPEEILARLQELGRTAPNFGTRIVPPAENALRWLGRLAAILETGGVQDVFDAATVRGATQNLRTMAHDRGVQDIAAVLQRAIARAELALPAAQRGVFITAGNPFDAVAAVGQVIHLAQNTLFFVDPYMDEKTLSTFAVMAEETVVIKLLAADGRVKPGLRPAAEAWRAQYGIRRPLEVRVVEPKTLHDRLIVVDGQHVWDASQSFGAFAVRSPATLSRSEADIAEMKIAAYDDIWQSGVSLL